MLQCLNGLHHVILDILTAPWRENNIFRFFEFGMQIEGGQNMISTKRLTQTLLILSV